MLKMLAAPPAERHHISFEEVLQAIHQTAQTGSLIYLISDFMSMSQDLHQEANISRLSKRCDVILLQLTIRRTIPLAVGVLVFALMTRRKFMSTRECFRKRAYEHNGKKIDDDYMK